MEHRGVEPLGGGSQARQPATCVPRKHNHERLRSGLARARFVAARVRCVYGERDEAEFPFAQRDEGVGGSPHDAVHRFVEVAKRLLGGMRLGVKGLSDLHPQALATHALQLSAGTFFQRQPDSGNLRGVNGGAGSERRPIIRRLKVRECGAKSGCRLPQDTAPTEDEQLAYGPFTRGRFVADQENGQ